MRKERTDFSSNLSKEELTKLREYMGQEKKMIIIKVVSTQISFRNYKEIGKRSK